jgi:hypothetical protein
MLEIKQQELTVLTDEHDERLMDLESIPLTENVATQFIRSMGLQEQFKSFIEEQLSQISRNIEPPPKVQ